MIEIILLYYMSVQESPSPILSTYREWNWNTDQEDQRERALNANYITYKTAQPYKITFVNDVNVQSHLYAGNFMANTIDVNDFFNNEFITNPFSLSWVNQNYLSIKTALINGTMNILGSVINLTATILNINAPITPLYTPENLNIFPNNGQFVSANTSNVIGRVNCNRGGNTYLSGIRTLASLSLTKGTWFLTGEWSSDSQGINNSMGGIAFNTTTNTLAGSFGGKQSIRLFAQPAPSQPMVTSAVINLNATTTVFMIGQTDNNGYFTKNQYLTAVRIA
jgi:hypothetical protein